MTLRICLNSFTITLPIFDGELYFNYQFHNTKLTHVCGIGHLPYCTVLILVSFLLVFVEYSHIVLYQDPVSTAMPSTLMPQIYIMYMYFILRLYSVPFGCRFDL